MKKVLFAVLLLCSVAAWSQQPNPADYPITVHVVSSRMIYMGDGTKFPQLTERLDVLIKGKKYVLEGSSPKPHFRSFGVIAPGDYSAKLTDDRHNGDYLSYQEYEILFPDKTKKSFILVGESE